MYKTSKFNLSMPSLIVQKLKDYQQLMKLNLSMLVVFSSVVGYIIVPSVTVEWFSLLLLFLGGLLVTAAANATNELLERRTDKLMKRTMSRPLPDSRMSMTEASIFVALTLSAGLFILGYYFNTLSALLSLASYLLYAFVYTPLKTVSSVSVLIGAIPGSLPCLIGWVAATNHMGSLAAWTLFIIQFFWQFPHFWSIAWVAHEDYERAGMKMLPSQGKVGHFTAVQCVLYSAILIPMSVLPMVAGIGGWISVVGLGVAAIWYLYNSVLFLKDNSDAKARKVMFASFVYLPVVLISLVIDKYL
ncbi:MAG: protoheme IX farnesyltransferase [Chitinophagaceae bacterium]|nr:protoheme IX farnesyltransferase [Chitinophagaceae bacterium]